MKIGEYEVTIKKGDEELTEVPADLPVHDFEGNTVTLGEVRDGYMRQADYTQKTQSVAEVKKFLVEDLGFQDPRQGVQTMKRVLDTLNEAEKAGMLDPQTGQLKVPEIKQAPVTQNFDDDSESGFTLGMENLPPEMKNLMQAHETLQKDMGSLMGYISRKEIRENFQDVTEEEVEMVHKLAAIEPSKSPMEHMVSYAEKKEEWGQKAVDTYVEELKKPKEEGHVRETDREPGIEIFGENPVFSYDPSEHGEGVNVQDPSAAANAYMKSVMEDLDKG
jgi:hypothetical protein